MSTINSNGTGGGLWNVGATWNGGVAPVDGDIAVILASDTVIIDSNVTVGTNPADQTTYVIDVFGTLRWAEPPTGDWTLTVKGNIRVNTTGHFKIGDSSNPIPASRTALIDFPAGAAPWQIRLDSSVAYAKGRLTAYGASSYHMASASMQRAQLTANVALGAGAAIVLDKAVDWQIGDVLLFGKGGSRTTPILNDSNAYIAGYGHDRTTITGKTDSQHFTVANLVNNHLAGDIVAHATRNVTFRGVSGTGFNIVKYTVYVGSPSTTLTGHGGVDLSWCSLRYAGAASGSYSYAAFYIRGYEGTYQFIGNGCYKMDSVVFDEKGAASVQQAIWWLGGSTPVRVTDPDIKNVIAYGFPYGLYFGPSGYAVDGKYTFGDLTLLNCTNNLIIESSCEIGLVCASIWGTYEGAASSAADGGPNLGKGTLICDEVKIHSSGYYGFQIGGSYCYEQAYRTLIKRGEVFNARGGGGYMSGGDLHGRPYEHRGIKFAHIWGNALFFNSAGNGRVYDCDFDNCNRSAGYDGPLALHSGAAYPMSFRVKKCRFGLSTRNKGRNITILVDETGNGHGRVRIEDCEFKEPIWGTEPTWGILGKWRGVIIYNGGGVASWYSPWQVAHGVTIEIVRPVVRDAAGVDQWPTAYPGVTHMAFFGGGGEMRNEGTVVIDGSYGMKFTPWNSQVVNAGSYAAPYKIPAFNGTTLTVKISLRKTIAIPTAESRPRAFLVGCGIFQEVVMPDTTDAWEELTLSGAVLTDGMVSFWVSPGKNFPSGLTDQNPWYFTVYADKLVVAAA